MDSRAGWPPGPPHILPRFLLTPGPDATRPREHGRKAVLEVPFGPRMKSVCCSSSGQSPLNKNNPHVVVFV